MDKTKQKESELQNQVNSQKEQIGMLIRESEKLANLLELKNNEIDSWKKQLEANDSKFGDERNFLTEDFKQRTGKALAEKEAEMKETFAQEVAPLLTELDKQKKLFDEKVDEEEKQNQRIIRNSQIFGDKIEGL